MIRKIIDKVKYYIISIFILIGKRVERYKIIDIINSFYEEFEYTYEKIFILKGLPTTPYRYLLYLEKYEMIDKILGGYIDLDNRNIVYHMNPPISSLLNKLIKDLRKIKKDIYI